VPTSVPASASTTTRKSSLAQGSPEQAADRLAALTRMARHVAQDRILISSLVGVAMSAIAFDEMRTLAASGTLTQPARDSLVKTLESLDAADPFLTRAALRGERDLAGQSMRSQFAGPDAGSKLVELMMPASDQDDATRLRAKTISAWDGERLSDETRRIDVAYDAMEAGHTPEATSELIEDFAIIDAIGTIKQRPDFAQCDAHTMDAIGIKGGEDFLFALEHAAELVAQL
jgi:hypothetical protein